MLVSKAVTQTWATALRWEQNARGAKDTQERNLFTVSPPGNIWHHQRLAWTRARRCPPPIHTPSFRVYKSGAGSRLTSDIQGAHMRAFAGFIFFPMSAAPLSHGTPLQHLCIGVKRQQPFELVMWEHTETSWGVQEFREMLVCSFLSSSDAEMITSSVREMGK